ncbi:MAG: hypothetical protein AB7S36_11140, partial [Planctomycetota bacterium]
ISFRMTLDELKEIAEGVPESRGINRQLELCFVGLASYFEGFWKDLFALALNVYPALVERLSAPPDGRDVSVDPMLAVHLGSTIRDKLGFILSERYSFGSAKHVNSLYKRLLKFKPFDDADELHYDELLRDRCLIVHHGATYTYRYLRQLDRNHDDAHWNSLVVNGAFYLRHHQFIEKVARKMLTSAHDELSRFGKKEYGFEDQAPVASLLDWEMPGPEAAGETSGHDSKSAYSKMLETQEQSRQDDDEADD